MKKKTQKNQLVSTENRWKNTKTTLDLKKSSKRNYSDDCGICESMIGMA